MALRDGTVAPPLRSLITASVVLVCAYIGASIGLVPEGEVAEFQFASERGSVTALSSVLLALGSAFALASFLVSPDGRARYRLFWFVLAGGLAFLALDELLQFHEQIGYRLDRVAVLGNAVRESPIRKWDDMIVILYGVVALPVALLFLPSVLRLPRVAECLAVAAVFYVIHTATDSLVEPRTTVSVIVEESAKLFCATFLAVASLAGLLAQVERLRAADRSALRSRATGPAADDEGEITPGPAV